MKRAELAAQLEDARVRRVPVRLWRTLEELPVNGYVVGVDADWFLMLVIGDGVRYDGFQAFRMRHVREVVAPSPRAAFYQSALRLRGARRPAAPRLVLSSTQALLTSAGRRFGLVTLHRGKADPGVCHIGYAYRVSATSVQLLEITPDAVWEDTPTSYRLAQVTRVDVGGPYEEALMLVAGFAKPRRSATGV